MKRKRVNQYCHAHTQKNPQKMIKNRNSKQKKKKRVNHNK
jgi:hypothetical protein